MGGWGGCKMKEMNGRERYGLENCKSRSVRRGEAKSNMLLRKDEENGTHIFRSEWQRQALGEGSYE